MELAGSLPSLNSMSGSSPENPKDHPTSQIQISEKVSSSNLNTNNKDKTHTEGDRLRKVARKRKGGKSLQKIPASKKRRLRDSSSNLSTLKEWALTKSREGPTTSPSSSDPVVAVAPKKSHDLSGRSEVATTADLAINRELLRPNSEGTFRKATFEKATRITKGVESGAGLEGERQASNNQRAAYSKKAKSVDTLASFESGEPLARGNRSTPDCRVLRPRRKNSTARSKRVLQVVSLCLADYTRIIGRRIKVFWPIDAQWYYGWIKEYDVTQKLHLVVYDDHEQEWLPLQKEKFKLQVFPGETFGLLGPTRSASSGKKVCVDHQEEVSARESGKSTRRWNGLRDGNAIGDDLLLSAIVPRGRLGGKFRKGLSNGTSELITPLHKTDGMVRESSSSVSSILRDKKRALRAVAVGKKGRNSDGFQTMLGDPISEVQEAARNMETSATEKHAASLFKDKGVLSRDASSESSVKTSDPGDLQVGKSERVYVRRHINRSKVRASLLEPDVSKAYENVTCSRPGRNNAAVGNWFLVATEGGSHQEQPPKSVNGSQPQTLDRASVAVLEGRVNLLPLQRGITFGQVVGLDGRACREANVASEQKHRIVSTTFSAHDKSPTSSDLALQDADLAMYSDGTTLWEEKIRHGYRSRNVSLSSDVKVLGNRVYPLNIATSPSVAKAKTNGLGHRHGLELQQQLDGTPASKLTLNITQEDLQRAFSSSLHCLYLNFVVPDLFTWQLFNILKVGFCNRVLLDERFHLTGSLQDWMGIVRLLLTIIKALPLSEWVDQVSPRHWQSRILQVLWKVLSRRNLCFAELSGTLPAKIEELLAQHLQYLILEANIRKRVTFRQIFNILVCYFIKPYVIATICEKGALLTVVIQRFLVLERRKNPVQGNIECSRQFMRAVRLRPGSCADSGFFSYLQNFPLSEDWCTESGLFLKQSKMWIASACTGHAEHVTPVPSVKFFNDTDFQVTTAHVLVKGHGSDYTGKDLHLELNFADNKSALKSVVSSLRFHLATKGCAFDRRFQSQINSCEPLDFLACLSLTSMLQKFILSAACQLSPNGLLMENRTHPSKSTSGVSIGGFVPSLSGASRNVSFHCQIRKGEGCRDGGFQDNDAVDMKTAPRQGESASDLMAGMTVGKMPGRRAKFVADTSMSASSTPSVLGYNIAGSAKLDGGPNMSQLPLTGKDGSGMLQDIGQGACQVPLDQDLYFTSRSPANASFEPGVGQTSTKVSRLIFRSQPNGDWSSGQRVSEPWRAPKMSSYQSQVLDRRKRKRGMPKVVASAYNDVSHLGRRRYGKRGRPSRQSRQDMVADQESLQCRANLLITKGDKGWREADVRVELQTSGSDCSIVVQGAGDKLYAHKVQQSTLTSISNCYTHARMWKGGTSWSLEFCDRKQWNLFKGLYEECGHQNARAASVRQIPIPGVRQVQDFDVIDLQGSPFHRPDLCYICQTDSDADAALKNTSIIYDMDSEDEAWLTEINGSLNNLEHKSHNPRVTEDLFEKIIDRLERFAYMKPEEVVSHDDAVEICKDQGPASAVGLVYNHWCKKRHLKGTALVRQFQPPLWEQYEKELHKWQASLNELKMHLSSASKEQLQERSPRPPLYAFCLRPRGLDTSNANKKMQKQRSHRKFTMVARTLSLAETSEDSPRSQAVFLPQRRQLHHQLANLSSDPDWHPPRTRLLIPTRYMKPVWQNSTPKDGDHEQLSSQTTVVDPFTKAEEAQARAVEARERAGIKAGKSQRLFLKFDSALHRAIAALIEYEAIHFAEQGLLDQEDDLCSPSVPSEQLSGLKDRVGHLSNQLFNLSEKSDNSDSVLKEESSGSLLDSGIVRQYDDENDTCRVDSQHEECEGGDTKQGFMGYGDALLPMSTWGHLDAWMGTTLLQRTDEGSTSQQVL